MVEKLSELTCEVGNYQTFLSEQVPGCGGVWKQRREKQRGEHMDVSSPAFTVSYAGCRGRSQCS